MERKGEAVNYTLKKKHNKSFSSFNPREKEKKASFIMGAQQCQGLWDGRKLRIIGSGPISGRASI